MGMGKSQGTNTSSNSQSTSRTTQQIAPFQLPALQNLMANAQGLYDQFSGPLLQRSQDLSNQFGGMQQDIIGQLQNTGLGRQAQPFLDTLSTLSQQGNPYLQDQIGALGTDIQRQLQGSLQNIGQGFVSAGQYGGSRQGLAEGQAVGQATDAFAQQAAALRANSLQQQQGAAQAGLGALNQNQAVQTAALQQALGGIGGAYNLGLAPYLGQADFLGSIASIIGSPTVLTDSQSQSTSRSSGSGGGGFNFSLI